MKAIIVCGPIGTGKSTIVEILAKKLGIKIIDGGTKMKEIAAENGFKPGGKGWWETKEGHEFLKKRTADPKFDKELDKRIIKEVKKGDVIISSRNIPWLVKDTINVWLTASEKTRIKRVCGRDNISEKQGKERIEQREKAEYDIYKKNYGIEYGRDMEPFQIIVETDDRTPEEVADMIIKKIKSM